MLARRYQFYVLATRTQNSYVLSMYYPLYVFWLVGVWWQNLSSGHLGCFNYSLLRHYLCISQIEASTSPPPGYLTPFPAQEGGDLITTHRGWGIWSLDKRICGGLVQNQRPTQAVFRLWRCLRTIYIYLWVYKYFKLYLQYKQLLNTKPLSRDTIYWGQLLWPTWCIYECLNTFCDNVFVGV